MANWESVSTNYKYPKLPDPRGIRPASAEDAKPGDVIAEGHYIGLGPVSKFGTAPLLFKAEDGTVTAVNGSGTLKRAVNMGVISVGDMVRVTYRGMEKAKAGQYKGTLCHQFTLEKDRSARKEMTPVDNTKTNNVASEYEDLEDEVANYTTTPQYRNLNVTEQTTTATSISAEDILNKYRKA
jgi:hypothetical protein